MIPIKQIIYFLNIFTLFLNTKIFVKGFLIIIKSQHRFLLFFECVLYMSFKKYKFTFTLIIYFSFN